MREKSLLMKMSLVCLVLLEIGWCSWFLSCDSNLPAFLVLKSLVKASMMNCSLLTNLITKYNLFTHSLLICTIICNMRWLFLENFCTNLYCPFNAVINLFAIFCFSSSTTHLHLIHRLSHSTLTPTSTIPPDRHTRIQKRFIQWQHTRYAQVLVARQVDWCHALSDYGRCSHTTRRYVGSS